MRNTEFELIDLSSIELAISIFMQNNKYHIPSVMLMSIDDGKMLEKLVQEVITSFATTKVIYYRGIKVVRSDDVENGKIQLF